MTSVWPGAVIPPSPLPGKREVPLAAKAVPVCERALNDCEALALTLAQVDVSAFKKKLLESGTGIWDDDYHNRENIKLTRPAHDAWGIKKIVFTFCDDFLQKVLDLPFSQSDEWREHLLPIYNAIGVSEKRIVRSLLALMPPGVKIPVHHDTGYWVKYTHRVHVAIITDPSVDFFVGPNEAGIQKYDFGEGRIVELNNQAKHAVTNNWDQGRVHLIFDYVDESFPLQRYIMSKGEQVYQTRRSIDLARHEGSRPSPSFVVIGAQKSGTTSLYEYLMAHPLCTKGIQRETHYFDWRWGGRTDEEKQALGLEEGDTEGHAEQYARYYSSKLKQYPSILTGESTPSYLFHYDLVIPRLQRLCPWGPYIFAIFRNPVERAYSQYRMITSTEGTPEQLKARGASEYGSKSFGEVVEEEIAELETMGVHKEGYRSLDFSRDIVSSRPMGHGGHSIVARGLYAFQLEPWLQAYPSSASTSASTGGESKSKVKMSIYSIGDLSASQVQATMNQAYSAVGLPPHELPAEDSVPRNTRQMKRDMEPEVRARLEAFYAPFNERLFSLVGRRLDENW